MDASMYCQNLLKNNKNQALKDIDNYIAQSMTAVSLADIGPNTVLPRVMDEINVKEVDISNASLVTSGAKLSSRIPMTVIDENGKEIKGYFTKETIFDTIADLKDTFEKNSKKKPEIKALFEEFFTKFDKYAKEKNGTVYNPPMAPDEVDPGTFFFDMYNDDPDLKKYKFPFQRVYGMMKKVGVNVPSIENLSKYKGDPAHISEFSPFEIALYNSTTAMSKVQTQNSIYKNEIGLNKGDNIDKRNAAMSSIAGLLGMPNIIVKSRPMVVVNNGQRINGTFLPNAEGIDISNFDTKAKGLPENFETNFSMKQGMKDVADLQVLDYLCGNIDRHAVNMLYKFDNQGNFMGLHGIDNDASFGLMVPKKNEVVNRINSLDSFTFMSKSTADALMSMRPEHLATVMSSHGLSQAEINAASGRLLMLKGAIMDGRTYYKDSSENEATYNGLSEIQITARINNIKEGMLKIIPDSKFKNVKIDSLGINELVDKSHADPGKFTRFNFINMAYHSIKEHIRDGLGKNYVPAVQPEVKEIKLSDEEGMTRNANAYGQKLKDLLKVDRSYIKSSPQFKNMRASLETLNALTDKYKDRALDKNGFNSIKEEMEKLQTYSEEYINYKSAQKNRSAYAESRLQFAQSFKTFLVDRVKELNTKIKNEVLKREDKLSDAGILLNEAKKALAANNNVYTPGIAAKMVRAANEASKLAPKKSPEAIECMNIIEDSMKFISKNPQNTFLAKLSKSDYEASMKTVEKGMIASGLKPDVKEIQNKISAAPVSK